MNGRQQAKAFRKQFNLKIINRHSHSLIGCLKNIYFIDCFFGRYTYAIGSNEEAVELSGIKTADWKVLVYVVDSFFVGLAGIIYAATYSTITPQTGNGQEMYAIAACVIGGTSLAGGVGTLSGTILGVFVISVLKTGLLSMGLPVQWQQVLIGVVVLLAVLVDVIRAQKAKRT